VYAAFAAGYIVLSSQLAAYMSAGTEELEGLEIAKGLGFVAVTSVAGFFLARSLMLRLERTTRALNAERETLLAAERFVLAGQLASSIAHDFRNLLTVVRAGVDELGMDDLSDQERREIQGDVKGAIATSIALASRLSETAQGRTAGPKAELSLAELAREAALTMSSHRHVKAMNIAVEGESSAPAIGHPVLVKQMVMNLVLNAAEATGGAGNIRVRIREDDDAHTLEVDDDGPGIPEDVRARLFEPFFTTKTQGTGLGLVSVRASADAHGGSVSVSKSDLGGARFTVRLPKAPADGVLH
jgi:signal transduction histidine kinase